MIKPVEKAVKTEVIDPEIVQKPLKTVENGQNSLNKDDDIDTSKLIQYKTHPKSIDHINKKIQYNQLIKLIKDGRYVSARLTAKAIGINFMTVLSWLKTAKAQQATIEAVDHYVDKIERVGKKDWKAYDRLLNYAVSGLDQQGQAGTVNNILVYNQNSTVGVQIGGQ